MMSKKRKIILIVIFVLLFLASVCVVVYPLVRNLQAEKQKDAIVPAYREAVADNAAISDELAAARAYNDALANGQAAEADYDALLDPNDTGMMGVVTIPAIGVELPIYHGTQSLSLGAVHLQGTSLPVGGESTHTVISAYSGMTTQKMFTDLDRLEVGDLFYLTVCGEKLCYEVDQIRTVLPEETDFLQIEAGQDLCTLLTCTPYGVNTHRLLVRGHRIEAPEEIIESEVVLKESTWMQEYVRGILYGLCAVAAILALLLVFFIIRKRRKRKCAGQ